MDNIDIRFLSTIVFSVLFIVFGVYNLLLYFVLKHKLFLNYCLFIFGITTHLSLYFFEDNYFADNISLITAMTTTYGLLIFTRGYLNIKQHKSPVLNIFYRFFMYLVVGISIIHFFNFLIFKIRWLENILILIAAFTALFAIILNFLSGVLLFNKHKLNRYYLYSNAPSLIGGIVYITGWFITQESEANGDIFVIIASVLISIQIILFSLITGYRFKEIEKINLAIQQDLNKKLKEEVSKQTRNLEAAKNNLEKQNEELEKNNQFKNQLFSLITHDVRAPLQNFQSIINLIESDLETESKIELSSKLKEEISKKIEMVNNFLLWSYKQLEGVHLEKTECNLKEIFQAVKEEFERLAKSKNICINIHCNHDQLFIDANMFRVILRNLLSNAIKFSPNEKVINIWSKKIDTKIEIGIKDEGIGMDVKSFFKLVEDNGRPKIKKGTEGEKGTGFGLLITKDFVEMNGGEIFCESEINKGTTFKIHFEDTKS